MRYISIIVVILIGAFSIQAQDFTMKQQRDLNMQIFKLFEDYLSYMEFVKVEEYESYDNEMAFIDMFEEDATIFCDIVPENRLNENISVNEYIETIKMHFSDGLIMKFNNFKLNRPEFNGSEGQIVVNYVLRFSGNTKYYTYYEDRFEMEAVINFKQNNGSFSDFKFASIKSLTPGKKFIKVRIQNPENQGIEGIAVTLTDGNKIKEIKYTNPTGKVEFFDIPANAKLKISTKHDDYSSWKRSGVTVDALLKPVKDNFKVYAKDNMSISDPNELKIILKPKKLLLDLYYSNYFLSSQIFSLGTISTQDESFDNMNNSIADEMIEQEAARNKNVSSYSFGVLLGYQFYKKNKLSIAVKTGISMSEYTAKMSIGKYSFQYDMPDADYYNATDLYNYQTRLVVLRDVEESITMSSMEFPLLFSFDYNLVQKLNLNAQLGFKYGMISTKVYESQASAYYQNQSNWYSPELGDTVTFIIGGNEGKNERYGTARYDLSSGEKDLDLDEVMYLGYGSLSVSYPLFGGVVFYTGVDYNYGIKTLTLETKRELSGNKDELNSITSLYDDVKINSMGLLIGIRYKF
jgi:hypothetical protein